MIGGFKYKHQRFNKEAIGVSSTMLIIVVVCIVIPSFYNFIEPKGINFQLFSEIVAVIMALIYVANLIFSLKTHKDLFDASDEIKATHHKPVFSIKFASLVLCLTTIMAAIESEFLVGTIKDAALSFGITETFIGVVIIAIITNLAEKSAAISFALKDHLDISLEIGLSSAIQIALFVVPILVFISHIFNYGFLLSFSIFEIISVILAVTIINHLAADGRCNWLEGAQLISVYLIIAIAFFFI
jgi:Ca2+:H+ antiporter